MKNLADYKEGRGPSEAYIVMHYWFFFRLEQAEYRQVCAVLRLSRFTNASRRQQYNCVGCDLIVKSGASAKDQSACESKSRGQSDCTQEPPLAAAQAIA